MKTKAGQNSRQKMINLMYIVFIALMGLGIQEDMEQAKSSQEKSEAQAPTSTIKGQTQPSEGDKLSEKQAFTALAIPQSRSVIQGTHYEADLHLLASAPQQPSRIVIEGQALPQGRLTYRHLARNLGEHRYSGYIEWEDAKGITQRSPFEERYEVIEPSIAIAPSLMQILYAGIDNRLSISASGIPREHLRVTAQGASIRTEGSQFILKPNINEGDVKLNISTQTGDGTTLPLGEYQLRVRPLPPPTAYLALRTPEGGKSRFKGGRISKQQLLALSGLNAAMDDGILDVDFAIQSFQLISFDGLGNAIPEVSSGDKFSARQMQQIEQAPRGKRLYITEIVARGPDAITHRLPPLELILQ